jgi:hypothetical protein
MSFVWFECHNFDKIRWLYDKVVPEKDRADEQSLINKFRYSHNYRCYQLNINGQNYLGIAIICYLRESKVLHVDIFAMAPSIRRNGLARFAWNSLMNRLNKEWPGCTKRIQIETYLQNCNSWSKIMGVSQQITQLPKPLHLETPIILMTKGISPGNDAKKCYMEWQNFQKMWSFAKL